MVEIIFNLIGLGGDLGLGFGGGADLGKKKEISSFESYVFVFSYN